MLGLLVRRIFYIPMKINENITSRDFLSLCARDIFLLAAFPVEE